MRIFPLSVLLLCSVCLPLQAQIVFQGLSTLNSSQQQELNRAKADIEKMLVFNAPVYINVASNSKLMCSGGSAVLAQAGPTNIYADTPGLPHEKTWYPASLAVQLSATAKSSTGTTASITAEFNTLKQSTCRLSWHYGTGSPGSYQISFYDTAIHEIMHGLGFISFWDQNGKWFTVNSKSYNDIFSKHLGPRGNTGAWINQLDVLTGPQLLTSNNVFWNGEKGKQFAVLLQGLPNKPKLYAPNPYESGSSISHFDQAISYLTGEQEMMEPYASGEVLSHLSAAVFCDIGWGLKTDFDGDGLKDCFDTKPFVVHDGEPVCDPMFNECELLDPAADEDNDGVINEIDNCPRIYNSRQLDGDADEVGDVCQTERELPDATWGEAAKQRFGQVLAAAGDINADGYNDFWVGAPHYASLSANKKLNKAGRIYLMSGKTNQPLSVVDGEIAGAEFGSQIVGNVDLDGDGCLDVVVAAPKASLAPLTGADLRVRKQAGAIYGYSPLRRVGDSCQLTTANSPELIYVGREPKALAGSALQKVVLDAQYDWQLMFSEPGATHTLESKKSVGALILLSRKGEAESVSVFAQGNTTGAKLGSRFAVGRFNGVNEEMIVAALAPGAKSNRIKGGVYWYSVTGHQPLSMPAATFPAGQYGRCLFSGEMIRLKGESNDELVVTSPNCSLASSKHGAVWFISQGRTSIPQGFNQKGWQLGVAVTAGDLNGDGVEDLILSAKQPLYASKSLTNAGSFMVVDGATRISFQPINGVQKNQQFGCALLLTSVDDDKRDDLIIASCAAMAQAKGSRLGAVQLIWGSMLAW